VRTILVLSLALTACSAKRSYPDDAQKPITFRLVNPSGFDRFYMDWTHEGRTELVGRFVDDPSVTFAWFHPPCTADCEEIPEGECGCLDCEPHDPVMMEFQPFGEVEIHWRGPEIYVFEEDSCGCTCVRTRELTAEGSIQVGLVAWDGCTHPDGECVPDAEGLVPGATPDGNRRCTARQWDLPYEPERPTLRFGTVCDSEWP
jgi:hypothetical protein